MRRLVFSLALILPIFASAGADMVAPVDTKALHNVFRIDAQLFSGNSPEDEAAFEELVRLGVKTIISVDGGKPNVELARRYGMRYVHLPIGYDGVPQARGEELVRAAQAADGPVYVHCHHGKHRGPTAVATICRGLKSWEASDAERFLKQAGTSPDYAGLFRDVRAFQPPSAETLARLPKQFPERVETPPMVDAMVAIDENFDALTRSRAAAWRTVPGHPDLTPLQAATLVWEGFRELARDPAHESHGADFKAELSNAEKIAAELRDRLRNPAKPAPVDAAYLRAKQNCSDCHKRHRN
jgi:protein tyrosine phosphatase (PTP) superfamily phosphohydrolase (DUF442 family)